LYTIETGKVNLASRLAKWQAEPATSHAALHLQKTVYEALCFYAGAEG
jgi:hypothetical protein